MQLLQAWPFLLRRVPRGEHVRGSLEQLRTPLRDLVRMYIESLGKLGHGLDLTRFRGHLNDWIEGVHDGEQSGSIYTGIQAANGGSGALRTHPGVFGEGVRPAFLVDLAMGQAGRASRA